MITKSVDVSSFAAPGTPITYSYLVSNTGNVTLTFVGVTDPMVGLSPVACPDSTLAPGDSETCTATYTTTQADVDLGRIANTGTVAATAPLGQQVTASSNLAIPAVQNPAITLVESADVSEVSEAGAVIDFGYLVTNSGNVTLDPVTLNDALPGVSAIDCNGVTSLGARRLGELRGDLHRDAGRSRQPPTEPGHHRQRPAAGIPLGPGGRRDGQRLVPAIVNPAITVVKSASPSSYSLPGTAITYSYLVTDTGNVTLTGLKVEDPMQGLSNISCPFTSLAPGQSTTCTATYTTTQPDVDAGQIVNTGTASGTAPDGTTVTNSSTLSLPAVQTVALRIVKTADPTTFDAPGAIVTYTFVATNVGNVTLHTLGLSDNMAGLSNLNCPQFTPPNMIPPTFDLAPGASFTCTATYTTTQADVDSSGIVNTAVVSGIGPEAQTPTDSDTVDVTPVQSPSIKVAKTADPRLRHSGRRSPTDTS